MAAIACFLLVAPSLNVYSLILNTGQKIFVSTENCICWINKNIYFDHTGVNDQEMKINCTLCNELIDFWWVDGQIRTSYLTDVSCGLD